MDPRQLDALAQRLAQNPQDTEALNAAYQHGQTDPRGYAVFLEKVAAASTDPLYAAHWFSEAANVWTASLSDAPRAARSLMSAVDRDPTNEGAAERLSQLYRDKGDVKGVVGLLERRVKALLQLTGTRPELRGEVARLSTELGRVWLEELRQNDKAVAAFRVAVENNREDIYAIYQLRELLKAAGKWSEAIPYFEAEQRLIRGDTERRLALYQDEAEACRAAGDLGAAARALRTARGVDAADPGLKQQLAANVLERIQTKKSVAVSEPAEAAQLFVELAEAYPGEHGYSYSACALECDPGNDRAAQLVMYYGEQLGQELGAAPLAAAYLRKNPGGVVAAVARALVSRAVEAGDDSLLDALAPPADAPLDERVRALLDMAKGFSRKARKREAVEKYAEVLSLAPGNEEAVEFVESHLRAAKKYAELRDTLLRAAAVDEAPRDKRLAWLDEVAALCEGQLKDVEGAIEARRRRVLLDPSDEVAADQLGQVLEKAAKWDELAELLERRAEASDDVELELAHERSAAAIHADKRNDPVSAAEAWARIARLTPDDETAVQTAVELFERGERSHRAAEVIEAALSSVDDDARATLGAKLGSLRTALGDLRAAGEAYAGAASVSGRAEHWEAAERCFVQAEAWEQAATAAGERARLARNPEEEALWVASEAEHLIRLGDDAGARARLARATELDPRKEEWAARLEALYVKAALNEDLVALWLRRAERLSDAAERRALRMRAALVQRDTLFDLDAMRSTLSELLGDGPDVSALRILSDDAERRSEFSSASEYLEQLGAVVEPSERVDLNMRHARVLAEGLNDLDEAIKRYEAVLSIDEKHRPALTRLADLQERTGREKASASSLHKLIEITDGAEKLAAARRLAGLYEGPLAEPSGALAAFEVVHALDGEDFEAIDRLAELSERLEKWELLAKYLRLLIDVEGDEEEVGRMTLRLAEVVGEKLGEPARALSVLEPVAALGEGPCRDEFVRLGDALGKKAEVADKLVLWFEEAATGPARNKALRGAFERYAESGHLADALEVGLDLVRTKGADAELARHMEELAVREKNLNALGAAHDVLVRDMSGPSRAEEMVRQAEVLSSLDVSVDEALERGEQALSSVAPEDVEPLLARLAKLAKEDFSVIGVYERQVMRCKAPADRLRALARAAEVASERKQPAKARQFFDIALSSGAREDQVASVVEIARRADGKTGGTALRRIVAEALAGGGQGARDGGKTRSVMLGHAAALAEADLADVEQAFTWLREALVAHVDDEQLDQLDRYAAKLGAPGRAAEVIGQALEEVFDGPLVRKLLLRRATIRQDVLGDKLGAAEDLKKLHDLSPADSNVSDRLSALYTEIGDYRGIVQLYEDQILRGKEPTARAELARKVALLWDGELADPREAADAWRRVLRMKPNDEEAKEGLARAKAIMLAATNDALAATNESKEAKPSKAEDVDAKVQTDESAEAAPAAEQATSKTRSEKKGKAEKSAKASDEATAAKSADADDVKLAQQAAAQSPEDEPVESRVDSASVEDTSAVLGGGSAETAPASSPDVVSSVAAAPEPSSAPEGAAPPSTSAPAAAPSNPQSAPVVTKRAAVAPPAPSSAPEPPAREAEPPAVVAEAPTGGPSVVVASSGKASPERAEEGVEAAPLLADVSTVTDVSPEPPSAIEAANDGDLLGEVDEDELIAGVDEDELIESAQDEYPTDVSLSALEEAADEVSTVPESLEALEAGADVESGADVEAAVDLDSGAALAAAPATDASKRSLPPPPPKRTSVPPPLPSAATSPSPSVAQPPLPSRMSAAPPPPARGSGAPPPLPPGRSLPPPPLPGVGPASAVASRLPPPGAKVPPAPPGPSSTVRPSGDAPQGAAGPSRPPPPLPPGARRPPPPPPAGVAKKS